MIRAALLAIALLPAIVAIAACGNNTTSRSPTTAAAIPSGLTLDDVYRRMEQAAAADSKILHASVVVERVDVMGAPTPPGYENIDFAQHPDQIWLYARDSVVRVETRLRYPNDAADVVFRSIVRSRDTFRVDNDGRSATVASLTCRGSDSPLLAQLMRCGNYLEKSDTVVETGEYRGKPAIVLVTTRKLPSEDASPSFTTRLYIDPSSNMPIAQDEQKSDAGGAPGSSYKLQERYDIELMDRSSLADDFFEPASIGYVPVDPTASLVPSVDGMRVYWLGERLAPAERGADLVLRRGFVSPNRSAPPGYAATLNYGLADQRYGPPVINMQEFPNEAWSRLNPDTGGHIWNGAGVIREDVATTSGYAVLFRIPASYERYLAHIYFDSTVILLTDFDEASPYSNRDAFIALIQALRPYK